MLIRPETPADSDAISALTSAAFAKTAYGDQGEAVIVCALRTAGALAVSLVAVEGGELLGHVAFSPVAIEGVDGGWFGLGPVSVQPDRQGEGIGAALIRYGLDILRQRRAAGCVVLGEPDYYRRFGFTTHNSLRFPEAPPEYFLGLSLSGESLPEGAVSYHPAFTAG